MTDAEVEQVLIPVRHAKMPANTGNNLYTFYGFDEFVTVVMAKQDGESRVTQIVHDQDDGPMWDRFRRNWERRLR